MPTRPVGQSWHNLLVKSGLPGRVRGEAGNAHHRADPEESTSQA